MGILEKQIIYTGIPARRDTLYVCINTNVPIMPDAQWRSYYTPGGLRGVFSSFVFTCVPGIMAEYRTHTGRQCGVVVVKVLPFRYATYIYYRRRRDGKSRAGATPSFDPAHCSKCLVVRMKKKKKNPNKTEIMSSKSIRTRDEDDFMEIDLEKKNYFLWKFIET